MSGINIRELFVSYGREIESFLMRRVGCRDTAADLTQDLFLRLMTLPQTHGVDNMRAYLYRAAANVAINHRIAESRRKARANSQPLDAVNTITPERILSDKDRLRVMAAALEDLPPLAKQVFTLIRIEGMKQADAAAHLKLHITTVEKNLSRAVRHCYMRVIEMEESPGFRREEPSR